MASIRHGLRAAAAVRALPAHGSAGIGPRLPPFSARAFSSHMSSSRPLHRPRLPARATPAATRALSTDVAGEVAKVSEAAAGELATASEAAAAAWPPVEFLSDLILNTPTPSYGLSIIALTLALRFGITLPFTLWQRARVRKNREIIVPAMKKINDRLAVALVPEARRQGWSYEQYKKELKKRLANEQSALHKEHGTHPLLTMLSPIAVNIPILIVTSMAIRHAIAVHDSALAAESFLWLPKLGDVDPSHVLPIVGALLMFGNAEVGSRKRSGEDAAAVEAAIQDEQQSEAEADRASAAPKAKATPPSGKRPFSTSAVVGVAVPKRRRRVLPGAPGTGAPSPATVAAAGGASGRATAPAANARPPSSSPPPLEDIESAETQQVHRSVFERFMGKLNDSMRLFAIVFLPLGAIMPSGVVLYWVTSIGFTLCQHLYFSSKDRKERAARASPTAWQRRMRRALVLFGTASTAYLFVSYLLGRMRDGRIRALKERRERETIKAHFTSLLSTISFTLYALLPTLQPQLFAAYPVEATSQALQAKSNPAAAPPAGASISDLGSLPATSSEATPGSTPADSLLLEGHAEPADRELAVPHVHAPGTIAESVTSVAESETTSGSASDNGGPHPGESWASEFQSRLGTSEAQTEDDMLTASTVSQSISLPPTDTSSAIPSPTSERLPLESPRIAGGFSPPSLSPPVPRSLLPRPLTRAPRRSCGVTSRWRVSVAPWVSAELTAIGITRAFATAYLVPLVYLLTSSQLTILARTRYLSDIKTANAVNAERERDARQRDTAKRSWFGYFSVDAMGLGDYVDRGTAAVDALSSIPVVGYATKIIGRMLPWGHAQAVAVLPDTPEAVAAREAAAELDRAEAERLFLTYSWWLLHEGWRGVASRVELAVDKVFGSMPLKRDISAQDWDNLVREIRAGVETDVDDTGKVHLYDFSPNILPPTPLPPSYEDCPLPLDPAESGPYLVSLLSQTAEQVSGPDARLLIDRGVGAMLAGLADNLRADVFGDDRRRLADLLPELNRWGRSIWEGIPDGGVETLLALPEFEAFAALIFGDWAPRS
ncbi:peroxin [Vanrija albida]|uniref:Peroxin n=1 Tax=Vanrija albida TaxID=181172 RepID=A0ABR3PUP7_9TREE